MQLYSIIQKQSTLMSLSVTLSLITMNMGTVVYFESIPDTPSCCCTARVFLFPFLQCLIKAFCKRCWTSKWLNSSPTEDPISCRKHCSWNLLFILWLCDISLPHHVTYLHNLCPANTLALRINSAHLLCCCCKQCWLWCVWADLSEETG